MKFNVKALSISFFFVSFYVVSCYYWSHNITISRDTKVYYDAYLNIVNVANPFGVEFVLSLIMNICNFLGMTFRELLLVLLLLWTPVICFLSYNSKKYPILIFASLFYISI